MGEIADMMLDGVLCATCGTYMGEGEGDGIPAYCCEACEPADFGDYYADVKPSPSLSPRIDKTNCPTCRKRVKIVGLADHMRAKHGVAKATGATP